jgi:anti-anti-sigma factor
MAIVSAVGQMASSSGVRVRVLHRSAQTIAALQGEIDIMTAPWLRERLLGVLRDTVKSLVLDLSGVGFCDACGLAVMVATHRRATLLGITLCLAGPPPAVSKMLHMTGLDRSLVIHPTLADALALGEANCSQPRTEPSPSRPTVTAAVRAPQHGPAR